MHFAFVVFSFLCAIVQVRAGAYDSSPSALDEAAQREITRREENLIIAEQELRAGNTATQDGDAKTAYLHYQRAIDLVPAGSSAGGLRGRALSRFSSGSVAYAEYLVTQGQYSEAQRIASVVLDPRYNPNYQPAITFLSRLEQADYFNKTITPEFAMQREQVNTLIGEAIGYYDSGRYDLAQKRYQQVLSIDKDNAAAFRGLEQVELAKQRYYDSAYNETRSRMLWQVERAWERPKRRFDDPRSSGESSGEDGRRGTELMLARLNRTIIPRVSFNDATVASALAFLRDQCRILDTEDNGQGINLVLDLPRRPTVAAPNEEGAAAQPNFRDTKITLNVSNLPLYDVLSYVAMLSGLKVKVEPFAVSLVPLDAPTEALEVREFSVPPSFIPVASSDSQTTEVQEGSATSVDISTKLTARQDAKTYLEAQGVQFDTGASARYIPSSSKLIVRNTPTNLDLIQALVEASKSEQPTQVEIEAKFVEVTQNNLKELGFDWTVGPFSIGDSGVFGGGGSDADSTRLFPFTYPGTGGPVGTTTTTGGLRTGQGRQAYSALSENSLSGLLLQNLGLGSAGAPAPGIFSIAGVFTNPQFQVVIRALNQKKGVDLMAAPKVTTRSGQKATITISRQFPYPQEFEPPQIPQDSGGGNAIVDVAAVQSTDPIVTPAFPTDFTTRDLGVTLEVEPQIGPDGYTIDLNLTPEVVDFEGFVNYGSPIFAPVTTGIFNTNGLIPVRIGGITTRRLLTDNVINQPIFSTRKVTTNVSIWDGQTVVLGGLISEDVQKVNDKVPILGDIPVAGALFRSDVERKVKRNLIIFTTARLIDAAGQPLRPEDDSDQEEIVEPLGLPPEIKPPRANPKSGITRK